MISSNDPVDNSNLDDNLNESVDNSNDFENKSVKKSSNFNIFDQRVWDKLDLKTNDLLIEMTY